MARNAIVKLGTDSRGNFQRDIGWETKASGKIGQHRFYFGQDLMAAQIRCLNTLACWDAVEKRWQKSKPPPDRPLWDKTTLAIALSVAAGQQDFGLDLEAFLAVGPGGCTILDESIGAGADVGKTAEMILAVENRCLTGKDVLAWSADLQADFPMIRIHLEGDQAEAIRGGVKASAAVYRKLAEDRAKIHAGPQSLFQAFDAFCSDLLRTKDHAGRPTEGAMAAVRQVNTLRDHAADMPLAGFGLREIEAMIATWRNRPTTKYGRPASVDHCKNCIKRIRNFVRWLHRSPDFDWRKPADYEVMPVRIPRSHAEKAKRISTTQVQTWSVEELATLYAHATPRTRLMMLLSLNCGFGRAELGSLQLSEIHLNRPHGYYPALVGSFIKRLRFKSDVYGEWTLWPETVAALEWYMSHRPTTKETALLVRANGSALCERTKMGNHSSSIANEWTRVLKSVAVDQPGFKRLSYNKLRKTGADLIRQAGGGETAAVYLCHGSSVAGDSLADLYSNRDFRAVFTALDLVRTKLAPVFGRVAEPFPAVVRRHNPKVPLSKRERIVKLRQEGMSYVAIAAACEVSIDTVFRYTKAAKLVTPRRKKERAAK